MNFGYFANCIALEQVTYFFVSLFHHPKKKWQQKQLPHRVTMKLKRAHLFQTYLAQCWTQQIVSKWCYWCRRSRERKFGFYLFPRKLLTLPAGEDMQQVQALLLRIWPVHQQEHYWEFVRNAESQALPQICWICILTMSMRDSFTPCSLRSTDLGLFFSSFPCIGVTWGSF